MIGVSPLPIKVFDRLYQDAEKFQRRILAEQEKTRANKELAERQLQRVLPEKTKAQIDAASQRLCKREKEQQRLLKLQEEREQELKRATPFEPKITAIAKRRGRMDLDFFCQRMHAWHKDRQDRLQHLMDVKNQDELDMLAERSVHRTRSRQAMIDVCEKLHSDAQKRCRRKAALDMQSAVKPVGTMQQRKWDEAYVEKLHKDAEARKRRMQKRCDEDLRANGPPRGRSTGKTACLRTKLLYQEATTRNQKLLKAREAKEKSEIEAQQLCSVHATAQRQRQWTLQDLLFQGHRLHCGGCRKRRRSKTSRDLSPLSDPGSSGGFSQKVFVPRRACSVDSALPTHSTSWSSDGGCPQLCQGAQQVSPARDQATHVPPQVPSAPASLPQSPSPPRSSRCGDPENADAGSKGCKCDFACGRGKARAVDRLFSTLACGRERLKESELRGFAKLSSSADGTPQGWKEEYQRLCAKYRWNAARGVDRTQFARYLSEEVQCSFADLELCLLYLGSRPDVVLLIFKILENGSNGHLDSAALRMFAGLSGHSASDQTWEQEYTTLSVVYGWDPHVGARVCDFARMVNDEPGMLYWTTENMQHLLVGLGSQEALLVAAFRALDFGGVCRLGSWALRFFAEQCGFCGSDGEWAEQYNILSLDHGFPVADGARLLQFGRLVTDEGSILYADAAELRQILPGLGGVSLGPAEWR